MCPHMFPRLPLHKRGLSEPHRRYYTGIISRVVREGEPLPPVVRFKSMHSNAQIDASCLGGFWVRESAICLYIINGSPHWARWHPRFMTPATAFHGSFLPVTDVDEVVQIVVVEDEAKELHSKCKPQTFHYSIPPHLPRHPNTATSLQAEHSAYQDVVPHLRSAPPHRPRSTSDRLPPNSPRSQQRPSGLALTTPHEQHRHNTCRGRRDSRQ